MTRLAAVALLASGRSHSRRPPPPTARRRRRSRSATRRSCGSSRTRAAAPASRTCRSTSTCCSASRRWRCAGRGAPATWSRSARPRRTSAKGLYEYHLDFPGNALEPGCDYLDWERRLVEGQTPAGLRARRDRSRAAGQARAPVLALLRLQRLEQPARGRLGDDPARLRRLDARRRRWSDRRSRSATASTRARSGRPGTTTSSSASTGRIRSCTRRPARTRTSTARRSTSAARPSRASAATTRAGRRSTSARSCGRSRATRRRRETDLPVDRVRGPLGRAPAGVLQRPDRAEPEDAVDGADRLVGRLARLAATRFPAAARSGPAATDFFCSAVGGGSKALVRLVDQSARVRPRARRARAARSSSCSRGRPGGPTAPLRLARRRAWGQILVGVRAHVRPADPALRRDRSRRSCRSRCS